MTACISVRVVMNIIIAIFLTGMIMVVTEIISALISFLFCYFSI